jgi:hypothetical protein
MAERKAARGLVTWKDLTVTLTDGRTISASYGYSDRYVTVKTALGKKMTHIGHSSPGALALIMLRELSQEGWLKSSLAERRWSIFSKWSTPAGGRDQQRAPRLSGAKSREECPDREHQSD